MDITLKVGAWYGDETLSIKMPASSDVKYFMPEEAEEISPEHIRSILHERFLDTGFSEKLAGKRSACIVTDDITRPTPVRYPLEQLIKIIETHIPRENIVILIATGAHKPMSDEEIRKKLGDNLVNQVSVWNHDFMGMDLIQLGDLGHGPVQLNRYFMDAEVKITLGGVLPHNETGFGGGAKLIIPGIAGYDTITYFHGALPPRRLGIIDGKHGVDRRKWAEDVSKRVGVDLSILIVINGRREPVDVVVGDVVEAHRIAARESLSIARTPITRQDIEQADLCVVNCYPMDSDPIQMGKALLSARKYFKQKMVVINRASDGIFYHGMGMGCGIDYRRLLRHSGRIFRIKEMQRFFRTIARLLLRPVLFARYSYFYFNALAYSKFVPKEEGPVEDLRPDKSSSLILYSENFPARGLRQKYPGACLIRDLKDLEDFFSEAAVNKKVVVIPCAPLQILDLVNP